MPRRRPQSTALVAAASRPLVDRTAATPRQAAGWQAECWTMFDEIGEVKYACNLAGNAMAKLRLYVAVYPADDPTNDPVPVLTDGIDSEKVDPDLAVAAAAELERLSSAEGGIPEVLRSLNINLEVAGELWLVGWDARGPGEAHGPAPERWEVRSISEVSWSGGGDERQAKVNVPGGLPRDVVRDRDGIVRVWVRHPRYGELADSNLRGVLSDCRAILVLQQQAIAESRSRMSAGAFTVPNELTIASVRLADGQRPPDDPDADPFLLALEAAMIDPIEDLSNPGSVSPFVIRGPAEFLQPQYLRRIDLGRQSQDIEAKVEQRVGRLARGMNLPVEVMLGHQQTTFSNAAQVDQDTFEDHYEPRARLLVDSLTVAYLRPGLIDAGWPDDQVRRLFVWYDPSLLIGSPDTDANADAAFENQAISWSAYRRAKGFDEADAPSAQEQLARTGLLRGIVNPELTAQLLNLLEDPHGDPVPVITAPTTNTPGDVVPSASIAQEAELLLALVDRGLLEVADDGTLRGRRPLAQAAIPAAASPVEDPGRVLLDIDRETRAKLQAATDAALLRALERAGNRIKGKAAQHRATLSRVAPPECASTLGPTLVAAAGLGDDDLLAGAWDQLEGQYRRLGASAQKRALGFAGRIVGGLNPEQRASYGLRQATDLDTSWGWMKENLTALAKARLYEPNPRAPDVGEFDPTSQSPTGLIRQAMRVAGGVSPSDNAAQISTNGEGSAWITTPDGSSPGGIATGQLISDIIRDEGGAIQGYRWVYGPADRVTSFLPHLRLDGLVFASFTDPRLVIGGSFPSTGHYIPGDHRGCVCDYEPIVLTPAQVAQIREAGGTIIEPPPGGEEVKKPPIIEPPAKREAPKPPPKVQKRDLGQFDSDAGLRKARDAVWRAEVKVQNTRYNIEYRQHRIGESIEKIEYLEKRGPLGHTAEEVLEHEADVTRWQQWLRGHEHQLEMEIKKLPPAERALARAETAYVKALGDVIEQQAQAVEAGVMVGKRPAPTKVQAAQHEATLDFLRAAKVEITPNVEQWVRDGNLLIDMGHATGHAEQIAFTVRQSVKGLTQLPDDVIALVRQSRTRMVWTDGTLSTVEGLEDLTGNVASQVNRKWDNVGGVQRGGYMGPKAQGPIIGNAPMRQPDTVGVHGSTAAHEVGHALDSTFSYRNVLNGVRVPGSTTGQTFDDLFGYERMRSSADPIWRTLWQRVQRDSPNMSDYFTPRAHRGDVDSGLHEGFAESFNAMTASDAEGAFARLFGRNATNVAKNRADVEKYLTGLIESRGVPPKGHPAMPAEWKGVLPKTSYWAKQADTDVADTWNPKLGKTPTAPAKVKAKRRSR